MNRSIVAAILALGAAAARASAVDGSAILELRDSTLRVPIAAFALIHEERDPGEAPSTLGFEPDRALFRPLSGIGELNRGLTRSAIWLCFTVRSAASARSWILAAGPNNADSVSVYIVDPDGRAETRTAGSAEPGGGRRDALADFAFRLTISPGEVKTVYLRFESEQSLGIRASLWDSFAYIRAEAANTAIAGLIFGVALAVFIVTIFIAISLRERSYGFYLAYLFGFLLYMTATMGVGPALLWPANAWFGKRAAPLFIAFMGADICLFVRAYVGTAKRAPILDACLKALAAAAAAFAVGLAFVDFRTMMLAGGLLLFAAMATVMAAAVRCAARRGRQALYFLVSWIPVFAGGAYAELVSLGAPWGGGESFWWRFDELALLLQAIILSYGISDSINVIRVEKEVGQRRSIELLERANKVKEEFLIGTSLEFRSPLYGIAGLAARLGELLERREATEERRLAALVQAEATRLLNSVANIATYARLRHGDASFMAERISLREAIEGAAGDASYLAAGRDIAIQKSADDARFVTDARAFQQIVYNLFADALKRSKSGTVSIRGEALVDWVRVIVADSAPPPPEEVLFRGFSVEGPGSPETLGPGLELLVTRLLAERLGGRLVYRGGPSGGSFELGLPLAPAWAAEKRGPAPPPSDGSREHRFRAGAEPVPPGATVDLTETKDDGKRRGRVLVFDEDPVFLEAIKHYLEDRGYAVLPAMEAERAEAIAVGDSRLDLALLDATGPRRPGLSSCGRIRGTKALGDLPIILMTDRDSADAVSGAFAVGASDYLPKLAPAELLFARVDTHVALKRAIAEAVETRRRVAEFEKLRTLGVLAAGVAHEINTPNNAVLRNLPVVSEVWTELAPIVRRIMRESGGFNIRGWSADDLLAEMPALLHDTYEAGKQIKKIVEDLKDYARDSPARAAEDVDLSAVAAYAARLLGPLVERSTRRFSIEVPEGLPPVAADFQKLTQVAVNVLENALESLPDADRAVSLRAFADPGGAYLALECRDEGVGIDPAVRERVFEPFFTTKRERGGTGLGLSVSHGIVHEFGGRIEIESEPGSGTTVRVVLPAARSGSRI